MNNLPEITWLVRGELSHLPWELRPEGRAIVLLRKSNTQVGGGGSWGTQVGPKLVQCFSLLLVSSWKVRTVCDPSHYFLECSLELDTQVPITL